MSRVAGRRSKRLTLNPERVLLAAVEFADEHGLDELSMRNLGKYLGVEAMSLYNHVANKDELLITPTPSNCVQMSVSRPFQAVKVHALDPDHLPVAGIPMNSCC